MKEVFWGELNQIDRELIERAERARENAYNPYSNFFVGAALLNYDGTAVIEGANVENASYGLTLCAERAALARAIVKGYKAFQRIAISTRGSTFDVQEPTMPCGACRQWLYEFSQIAHEDLVVISANTKRTKILKSRITELLTGAFGPNDLGINLSRFREGLQLRIG